MAKLGLPKIPLHGLRHTWATIALSQNVHPKVVSERLGHSTISMTLDTYSDVLPGLQEEAAASIAALIVGLAIRLQSAVLPRINWFGKMACESQSDGAEGIGMSSRIGPLWHVRLHRVCIPMPLPQPHPDRRLVPLVATHPLGDLSPRHPFAL